MYIYFTGRIQLEADVVITISCQTVCGRRQGTEAFGHTISPCAIQRHFQLIIYIRLQVQLVGYLHRLDSCCIPCLIFCKTCIYYQRAITSDIELRLCRSFACLRINAYVTQIDTLGTRLSDCDLRNSAIRNKFAVRRNFITLGQVKLNTVNRYLSRIISILGSIHDDRIHLNCLCQSESERSLCRGCTKLNARVVICDRTTSIYLGSRLNRCYVRSTCGIEDSSHICGESSGSVSTSLTCSVKFQCKRLGKVSYRSRLVLTHPDVSTKLSPCLVTSRTEIDIFLTSVSSINYIVTTLSRIPSSGFIFHFNDLDLVIFSKSGMEKIFTLCLSSGKLISLIRLPIIHRSYEVVCCLDRSRRFGSLAVNGPSTIRPVSHGKEVFVSRDCLVSRLIPLSVPIDSLTTRRHTNEQKAGIVARNSSGIYITFYQCHLYISTGTAPCMDKEYRTCLVPQT